MALSIPPVPRRSDMSREVIQFLEALRAAVGGDQATIAPSQQADVLAPVGLAIIAADDLAAVAVPASPADAFPPVCGCDAAMNSLEPV